MQIKNQKGQVIAVGARVQSDSRSKYFLRGHVAPRHSGSTGRVLVSKTMRAKEYEWEAYYPSVFGLQLVAD